MTLPSTGDPSASWTAVVPILAGVSFNLHHPPHAETIAIGSFLLTGIAAAAVARFRARREASATERKPGPEKLCLSLITLSSAPVLSVYAAGYWHTQSAEDQYERQAALRRTAVSPGLSVTGPPAPLASDAAAALRAGATPSAARLPHKANPDRLASPPKVADVAPVPVPSGGGADVSPPPSAGVAVGISTDDPAVLAGNPLQGESSPPAPAASAAKYKSGTFFGWGSSRHGDIQASVEIRAGKIVSATITECLTRYSCSVIDPLPPQVIKRQNANVDNISGATESTDAFFDAISDALSKTK